MAQGSVQGEGKYAQVLEWDSDTVLAQGKGSVPRYKSDTSAGQ